MARTAWNAVVICIDTLRVDMLGWRGGTRMHNLSRLAEESVVFANAFGEGEPTLPVRRALFSGMRSYPWWRTLHRRGLFPGNILGWGGIPDEQTTLAEYLLAAGYTTYLIADTYHLFKPTLNFVRGFCGWDFVRGQEGDSYRTGPLGCVDLAPFARDPADLERHAGLFQYLVNNRHRRREEDWSSAQVFIRGMRWLDENAGNDPFFLWLDCFDPHEPWDPPRHYADLELPDYRGTEFIFPREPTMTPPEQERVKALYYGEVRFVDRWAGEFLNHLDELGLRDNTLVVLLSDHGTELQDRDRFGKWEGHLHWYNTQMNWFVRHPEGELRGRRVNGLVQSHDVAPTLLELLSVRHGPMQGVDVWPLATGAAAAVRPNAVIGWQRHASVRDLAWNYVVDVEQPEAGEELYRLDQDPLERHNVAERYPEAAGALRQALEDLLGSSLPVRFPVIALGEQTTARTWMAHRNPQGGGGPR